MNTKGNTGSEACKIQEIGQNPPKNKSLFSKADLLVWSVTVSFLLGDWNLN